MRRYATPAYRKSVQFEYAAWLPLWVFERPRSLRSLGLLRDAMFLF